MKNKLAEIYADHSVGVAIALITLILLLSFGFAFGVACLWGWVFMLVWNNLLPLLWAEAPTIGFWLATGIVFVVRLLIKPVTHISHD